jgi:uncharacterized protein
MQHPPRPTQQGRPPRLGLPNLGLGVGLRNQHFDYLMRHDPPVDWFEIISENFIDNHGFARRVLERVRSLRPVVMHGVSLSVGSTDPPDPEYLKGLKALAEFVRPEWVSDHLCWTGVAARNTHDLLPLPYTEEALRHTVERVRRVQDFLGAPLLLENPSTYVEFAGSSMTEWDFLAELAEKADCGLLLDVNNVYVSAYNHGYRPEDYLNGIPFDRVAQMHVAGHTHQGTHIVDTHIGPVIDPVWELAREAYRRAPGTSLLLEWDAEIPPFEEVHREALKATTFVLPRETEHRAPPRRSAPEVGR